MCGNPYLYSTADSPIERKILLSSTYLCEYILYNTYGVYRRVRVIIVDCYFEEMFCGHEVRLDIYKDQSRRCLEYIQHCKCCCSFQIPVVTGNFTGSLHYGNLRERLQNARRSGGPLQSCHSINLEHFQGWSTPSCIATPAAVKVPIATACDTAFSGVLQSPIANTPGTLVS